MLLKNPRTVGPFEVGRSSRNRRSRNRFAFSQEVSEAKQQV
jgi:hypothetical protein